MSRIRKRRLRHSPTTRGVRERRRSRESQQRKESLVRMLRSSLAEKEVDQHLLRIKKQFGMKLMMEKRRWSSILCTRKMRSQGCIPFADGDEPRSLQPSAGRRIEHIGNTNGRYMRTVFNTFWRDPDRNDVPLGITEGVDLIPCTHKGPSMAATPQALGTLHPPKPACACYCTVTCRGG